MIALSFLLNEELQESFIQTLTALVAATSAKSKNKAARDQVATA